MDLAEADARFALVHAALAAERNAGSVTVGMAELGDDDTAGSLLARADARLYQQRAQR